MAIFNYYLDMKRTLGFLSIFCISAGAMISSGLFVLPGLAFDNAGPAVFIAYGIAGLVALTTVFSLSELITAMPMAGGDYFYVSRSFGPLFGTVSGLLSWLALSLKSAFAVIGISELLHLTFGLDLRISAIALASLFTFINLFGVKEAVRFQIILVIALLGILGIFFIMSAGRLRPAHYSPFLSHGWNALFSTAGFVFVSFGGVLTTASIAGEVKNPKKNIPLGLIASTLVVTLFYTLIILAVVGVVPKEELSGSMAPIALAGRTSGGLMLYGAIMIASLLAFITTANGGILTASRYPIALAGDGMLPPLFSKVSKKKQTPFIAVIATGLLISGSVLLNLDLLIKAASTVILLSNIFAHLSVLVMRESKISNYRPSYYSPFYPWLQIVAIMVFIFLIIDMGIQPMLISLIFISAGVLLYLIRKKSLERVSPALLHVVERLTNRKLVTEGLKEELRGIIEARDNIIRDEFDQAVEAASFLDLKETVTLEELWEQAATVLHKEQLMNIPEKEIAHLLDEREQESSTAISSFVAIPHIILDRDLDFGILLVRSSEGIDFGAGHPSVKALFVLVGTQEKRNLHLKALAAIAQIVQQSGFEKQWLNARKGRDIKDLILLSNRKR